jgi:hypothetical protein
MYCIVRERLMEFGREAGHVLYSKREVMEFGREAGHVLYSKTEAYGIW